MGEGETNIMFISVLPESTGPDSSLQPTFNFKSILLKSVFEL